MRKDVSVVLTQQLSQLGQAERTGRDGGEEWLPSSRPWSVGCEVAFLFAPSYTGFVGRQSPGCRESCYPPAVEGAGGSSQRDEISLGSPPGPSTSVRWTTERKQLCSLASSQVDVRIYGPRAELQ